MKNIYTQEAPEAIGPYSQGMIVNNLFYSSGQIPLKPDGTMVGGRNRRTNAPSIFKYQSSS